MKIDNGLCQCCVNFSVENNVREGRCSSHLVILTVFHGSATFVEASSTARELMTLVKAEPLLRSFSTPPLKEAPFVLDGSTYDEETDAVRNLSLKMFEQGDVWVWQFQESRVSPSRAPERY